MSGICIPDIDDCNSIVTVRMDAPSGFVGVMTRTISARQWGMISAICDDPAAALKMSTASEMMIMLLAFVGAYDVAHPMRTADQHEAGCGCLRCVRDGAAAVIAKATGAA